MIEPEEQEDPEKRCGCCRRIKRLADFYRCARTKDGLQGYCKVCQRTRPESLASVVRSRRAKKRETEEVRPGEFERDGFVMRNCRCCETPKALFEFPDDPRGHRGLAWTCRACKANKRAATRNCEPSSIREYKRRVAADERRNETDFDALAANTAEALGR